MHTYSYTRGHDSHERHVGDAYTQDNLKCMTDSYESSWLIHVWRHMHTYTYTWGHDFHERHVGDTRTHDDVVFVTLS